MSEQKERIKYKFGRNEIDLDDYIYNLGTNLQTFLDNKKLSEGQKQEFLSTYNNIIKNFEDQLNYKTNRFSTDDAGVLIDNTGQYQRNNTKNYYSQSGDRISEEDYNALKPKKQKEYIDFDSDGLVATYFNEIGKAMVAQGPKAIDEKEKFDLTKHGFVRHWSDRNNPLGGSVDLNPYLNMDEYDKAIGKRDTSKRSAYLAEQLEEYLNNLQTDKYDFSATPYENEENYRKTISELITKLKDNNWGDDDTISANKAGISGSFYQNFFSTAKDPSKTKEEIQAEIDQKIEKERKKAKEEWITQQLNNWSSKKYLSTDSNPFLLGALSYWSPVNGYNEEGWQNATSDKFYDNYYIDGTFQEGDFVDDSLNNLFSTNKQQTKRYLERGIGTGYIPQITSGAYQGMYLVKSDNMNAVVYDPSSGKLFNTFIGNIPDKWKSITDNYNFDQGLINPISKYMFKEGGQIQKMQSGAEFEAFMQTRNEDALTKRAINNKKTTGEQKASERIVGWRSQAGKENDFTTADMIRIGSAAADIASILTSYIPGAGTMLSAATGISSTIGNFVADLEDGFQWSDLGNAATGFGMDLLGLIPGGGTASKMTKIVRNLGKIVPTILAAIGTINTLHNADNIIKSFKKISNEPLTVQDWRNIAEGLGAVAGLHNVGRRAIKNKQLKNQAKANLNNAVAVDMTDSKGNKRTVLFEGEDATAIRQAQGDVDKIKAVTDKSDELKDFSIDTKTAELQWVRYKGADNKKHWRFPIGEGAAVREVTRDYNPLQQEIGTEIYAQRRWDNDIELSDINRPLSTRRDLQAVRDLSTKNKEYINKANTAISTVTAKRDGVVSGTSIDDLRSKHADILAKRKGKSLSDPDSAIKQKTKLLATKQKQLNDNNIRINEIKKHLKDPALTDLDRHVLNNELNTLKTDNIKIGKSIDNANTFISNYGDNVLNDVTGKINLYDKYDNAISNINNNIKAHDNSVRMKAFVDGLPVVDGNVIYGDIKMPRKDFEAALIKAGIFKQGGQLNTEKVRNFKKKVIKGEKGLLANFWQRYKNGWKNSIKNSLTGNYEETARKIFEGVPKGTSENKNSNGMYATAYNIPGYEVSSRPVEESVNLNETSNQTVLNPIPQPDWITYNTQDSIEIPYVTQRNSNTGNYSTTSQSSNQTALPELSNIQISDEGAPVDEDLELIDAPIGAKVHINPVDVHVGEVSGNTPKASRWDKLRNLSPTITHGIPRAIYADSMNRKITNLAKAAQTPFLKNTHETHRTINGDLDSLSQGNIYAAQVNRLNPMTSDASLQTAAAFEALNKGIEYQNQGRIAYNKSVRDSSEKALLQEQENAINRMETANSNQLSIHNANYNRNKLETDYLNKKHTIWDTLGQQFETLANNKFIKKQAYADEFAKSDIHDSVTYDLENQGKQFGMSFTPQELDIWKKVVGGTNYSDLSDEEKTIYSTIHNKASQIESNLLRRQFGIPEGQIYYQPQINNTSSPQWILRRQTPQATSSLYTLRGKTGGSIKLRNLENYLKSKQYDV